MKGHGESVGLRPVDEQHFEADTLPGDNLEGNAARRVLSVMDATNARLGDMHGEIRLCLADLGSGTKGEGRVCLETET